MVPVTIHIHFTSIALFTALQLSGKVTSYFSDYNLNEMVRIRSTSTS